MKLADKLSRYIDAGFPILYVNTFEEAKVYENLESIADRRKICLWSYAKGYSVFDNYKRIYTVANETIGIKELLHTLLLDDDLLEKSILVLKDAHMILNDQECVALLKEIALQINNKLDCNIVLISPLINIPSELEKFITFVETDFQTKDNIKDFIRNFINSYKIDPITPELLDELSNAFKGLSEYEIENLLALAIADDGELTRKDLSLVYEQKKQMVFKSGILEMIDVKENINDIGGLEDLKEWLQNKAKVVESLNKAVEYGVSVPKGVLIAGVPGCGKSLCAKATAKMFQVPLLKMDIGKLMGQYLGESERNMRKAIRLAEATAPCVLWIDELEKAFSGVGSGGHEVTNRLFGTFLTWMQDKKEMVFVVATANNISNLPPELLRKGRFDETFYVGLPNSDERKKIIQIHINKRRKDDLKNINLNDIVNKTEGCSGADLEGIICEAIETAFVTNSESLTTAGILDIRSKTNPLYKLMKDSIDKMKKDYESKGIKPASK